MLANQRYGRATDVFSFGVVLWELITLRKPWLEENVPPQYKNNTMLYTRDCVQEGKRLHFPDLSEIQPPCPEAEDLRALVEQCWDQDPALRPTMTEVGRKLRSILDRHCDRVKRERQSASAQSASALQQKARAAN